MRREAEDVACPRRDALNILPVHPGWARLLRVAVPRRDLFNGGCPHHDATLFLKTAGHLSSSSIHLHHSWYKPALPVDLGSQGSVSSFIKHLCNCKAVLGVEVIARNNDHPRGIAAPPRDNVRNFKASVSEGLSGDTLRVCQQVCDKEGVFVTGPPGSGKTFLLRKIIRALRDAGVTVAVCGTTGVAANMVGGITAHSWAGFIHGHADISHPLDHVVHEVTPRAAKGRMRDAMVLVIDEIGAISAEFLERLDEVLRATDDDLALLASRRTDAPRASAVRLTTHTSLAAAKNDTEMAKLEGQAVAFSAVDVVIAPYISMKQASGLLDDGTDFVRRLVLRVGAVVAVRSNCFHSRGVPTGSRGVVESIISSGPAQIHIVRFFLAEGGFVTVRVLPITTAVHSLDGLLGGVPSS
ncbi:hypothetical protein I4F81_011880 [Pyropia yezoensis]|uniref:Uncharacterized protein n=1 Tax=Pyropia yezoensis TaxID=2788 RepID=A0ACC3CHW1_PYRYE|nr:hypothetical protein I4F81_011880 [Neopyropia yezoensis]